MVTMQELELDPESIEALEKFLALLKKLNETGILDALIDLLEPPVLGTLTKTFLNLGTLKALDHMDKIGELLEKIDYEGLPYLAPLINSTIEAMKREPKPTGAFGMLRALRNKKAKRGMGVLVELLKALGEQK